MFEFRPLSNKIKFGNKMNYTAFAEINTILLKHKLFMKNDDFKMNKYIGNR